MNESTADDNDNKIYGPDIFSEKNFSGKKKYYYIYSLHRILTFYL